MTIAWNAAVFSAADDTVAAWKRHGAALAATLAALFTLFAHDVATLAHLWWTSTTFGHCLFILPVFGWLVWLRREQLARIAPTAWWPGLAVVGAGGFGWLLGEAASVSLVRQLGLLLMVQGTVAALLGPNVFRALLFPLAYLVFLVPFGNEIEGPLQTVTAAVSVKLLHLVGVPADIDGVLITTPTGYFEVAEACSGAKFVLAMLAYGTLVAHVCYVSWRRRAAFMAMALVVPVIANCLRAFGTMYAAHLTSVEAATGLDHIIYGWVFFALVMAAVIAIGWRWFDRSPDDAVIDPARFQGNVSRAAPLPQAAGAVLAIAVVFAGWAWAIERRADPVPAAFALPQVPGWTLAPLSTTAPWAPNYPGADRFAIARYVDGRGRAVDLAVAFYASQHDGKELIAFGQGAIRENDEWVRIAGLPPIAGGDALRMTAPGPVERQVVTWYRVADTTTGSQRAAKLATLKAKLLGGPQRASAVLMSAEAADGTAAIADFRAALGDVGGLADRLATGTR